MDRYRIHVESLCFTDELGEEFDLPYTEELANAVIVINRACSEEVERRHRYLFEEFASKKYHELMEAKTAEEKRKIMYEINQYKPDRR